MFQVSKIEKIYSINVISTRSQLINAAREGEEKTKVWLFKSVKRLIGETHIENTLQST